MGTIIKWIIVLSLFGISLSKPQKRQYPTTTCQSSELFHCKSGECIYAVYRCDGYAYCIDGSDECGCPEPTAGPTANPGQCTNSTYIPCADGNGCYPPNWECDNYVDCTDKSDEEDCPATTVGPTSGPSPSPGDCDFNDIKCDDGNGCYPPAWKCDGIVDCQGDQSDEANCPATTVGPTSGPSPSPGDCDFNDIKCDDGNGCYPPAWKCDGIVDCQGDQSDEANCPATTPKPTGGPSPSPGECSADKIKCDDGNGCYPPEWKCDGIVDCNGDQSDEANCPSTTGGPTPVPTGGPGPVPTGGPGPVPTGGPSPVPTGEPGPSPTGGPCQYAGDLQCADGNGCYPPNWKCDNYPDCQDKSDELNCPATTTTTAAPPTPTCGQDSSKCDGSEDCENGSDEQGCEAFTCPAGKVKCGSSGDDNKLCVPENAFCDGYQDCPDGGDELESICKARTCDAGEFRCSDGACLPSSVKCNGFPECKNGDDESGCTGCPNSVLYQRCTDGKYCIEKSSRCDGIKDCLDNSDETGCPSKRGLLLRRFERLLNSIRTRERRSAMRHPMSVAQRAINAMQDGRQRRRLTLAERRAHVRASVRRPDNRRRMESRRRLTLTERREHVRTSVRHPVSRRHMESREQEVMRKRSQTRHENLKRRMHRRHDDIKRRLGHNEAARRHLMERLHG